MQPQGTGKNLVPGDETEAPGNVNSCLPSLWNRAWPPETETCWLQTSYHLHLYNAVATCISLIKDYLLVLFTDHSEQQESSPGEASDEPVSGSLEEKPRPSCPSAREKSSYSANNTRSIGEKSQEWTESNVRAQVQLGLLQQNSREAPEFLMGLNSRRDASSCSNLVALAEELCHCQEITIPTTQ